MRIEAPLTKQTNVTIFSASFSFLIFFFLNGGGGLRVSEFLSYQVSKFPSFQVGGREGEKEGGRENQ